MAFMIVTTKLKRLVLPMQSSLQSLLETSRCSIGERRQRPRAAGDDLLVLAGLVIITALSSSRPVSALPTFECSVDYECLIKDPNAICDTNHSLCVCTKGRYREPPYRSIRCSIGKAYNERCRSPKECVLVDQFSDCIGGVCRCNIGYNPIPVSNNSQGSVRCMLDPFYLNADHAHLTFFKVGPVPLLVICIILVYLGYQRGAKVPQRRGSSSSSNRRIVPMWRGVTFHQTTPPSSVANNSSLASAAATSGQPSVTPPRNSTSGSSGGTSAGSQPADVPPTSTAGAGERDGRRGRGSAHSRRDSNARERHERIASHSHNVPTATIAGNHNNSNNNNGVGGSSSIIIINSNNNNHTTVGDSQTQQPLHQHQQQLIGAHVYQQNGGLDCERRNSAMSPPPPYAQEEAPPSYEDAIRVSRVALSHEEVLGSAPITGCLNEQPILVTATVIDSSRNVSTQQ